MFGWLIRLKAGEGSGAGQLERKEENPNVSEKQRCNRSRIRGLHKFGNLSPIYHRFFAFANIKLYSESGLVCLPSSGKQTL